jgi:hypothetical protein
MLRWPKYLHVLQLTPHLSALKKHRGTGQLLINHMKVLANRYWDNTFDLVRAELCAIIFSPRSLRRWQQDIYSLLAPPERKWWSEPSTRPPGLRTDPNGRFIQVDLNICHAIIDTIGVQYLYDGRSQLLRILTGRDWVLNDTRDMTFKKIGFGRIDDPSIRHHLEMVCMWPRWFVKSEIIPFLMRV